MARGAVELLLLCCAALIAGAGGACREDLDCDSKPVLRVVAHGDERETFWQTVHGAASQAAADFGAALHWEWPPPGTDPSLWMREQIEAAVPRGPASPDALIVTIPSTIVSDALAAANEAMLTSDVDRIPMFGLNSGFDRAQMAGVVNFFGQHEVKAGERAGTLLFNELEACDGNLTFVDHLAGTNDALGQRLDGFRHAIDALDAAGNCTAQVQVLELSSHYDRRERTQTLLGELTSPRGSGQALCWHDGMVTNGADTAQDIHSLLPDECLAQLTFGTFDSSDFVKDMMKADEMSFAILQQEWLQGYATVAAAAIHAKTGMHLHPPPNSNGTHMTGPSVQRKADVVGNRTCGTPVVCAGQAVADPDAECPCVDRSQIRIAGVHHGTSDDVKW